MKDEISRFLELAERELAETDRRDYELHQRSVGDGLMSNLYRWCEDGWGYSDKNFPVGMRPYPHGELCSFIESVLPFPGSEPGQKLAAIAAPRGTFKSVIGVNGTASYFTTKAKLAYGMDTRTIIGRSAQNLANDALAAIKETFTRNRLIAPLVFEGVKNQSSWRASQILLGWRSNILTDPTIATTGLDVGKTGTHVDLILLDDLINETNFDSPRALEYAWNLIQSFMPILETNGTMIVTGTFWSAFDHFQKIIAQNIEEASQGRKEPWKLYIRGAYREDEGHEGELYFPEKLNEKFLEDMRRRTSPKFYSCWYLNKIEADENKVFKPKDIRFYDGEFDSDADAGEPPTLYVKTCGSTELEDMVYRVKSYLLCDTAVTTTARSNNTGLILVLVDEKNRWWIHDAIKLRETPSRVIERIVGMTAQYENEITSIETVSANVLFADAIQEAYRANGIRCKVIRFNPQQLKSDGVSLSKKSTRIEWLEPKFRRGEVFIRRGLRGLLRELETYDGVTREEHYDLLDALSQGIELCRPVKAHTFEEGREDMEIKWHEDFVKNAKANKNLGGARVATRPYFT